MGGIGTGYPGLLSMVHTVAGCRTRCIACKMARRWSQAQMDIGVTPKGKPVPVGQSEVMPPQMLRDGVGESFPETWVSWQNSS